MFGWAAFCVLSALYIVLLVIEDRKGHRVLLVRARESIDALVNEGYLLLWRAGTITVPLSLPFATRMPWAYHAQYTELCKDLLAGVFGLNSKRVTVSATEGSQLSQVALHKQDVALSDAEKRRRKAMAIEGKTRLQSRNKTA